MRNLKCLSSKQTPLLPCTTSFALDEYEGHVYHVSKEGQLTCTQLFDGKHVWHVQLGYEHTQAHVVDLSVVNELGAVCAVLANGHILTVALDASRHVEEVGCVPEGVLAGAWNPSGEVLTILTANKRLVALSLTWDVLADVELPDHHKDSMQPAVHDHGPHSLCGITWRGDGQYLAVSYDCLPGSQQGALLILDGNEFAITAQGSDIRCNIGAIAWQPNGRNLYAAQNVDMSDTMPEWVRSCQGETGPDASGITPAAYPESNSVAQIAPTSVGTTTVTTHAARNQAAVGIFETNGLPHGGFWADHSTAQHESSIVSMQWSYDSEILALVLMRQGGEQQFARYSVQLWRRSNWHWYLLREEQHDGSTMPPIVCWGSSSLQLFCCTNSMLHQTCFAYDSDVSTLGTVALVDGAALNITPMRDTVIPPPMAATRLTFDHPVQLLAWSPSDGKSTEAVAVVLSSGAVCIVHTAPGMSWPDTVEQVFDECVPAPDTFGCWQAPVHHACHVVDMRTTTVQHMCFVDINTLLLCTVSCNVWELVTIIVNPALSTTQVVISSNAVQSVITITLPGPVRHLVPHTTSSAWMMMDDASIGVLQYDAATHQFTHDSSKNLAAFPTRVVRAMSNGQLLGLTANGELVVNDCVITQDCTSFLVTETKAATGPLVLWTTRDQRLFVRAPCALQQGVYDMSNGKETLWDKPAIMQDAMRPTGAIVQSTLSERAVEQGSMLLAAPPGRITLVMHLPRGNLETVQPRAFVLPAIVEALACHDYATAWRLVVLHRVDVNIMVDYRWPLVLKHAGAVVEGVCKASDMCDLLQGLQYINILDPTSGMYRELWGLLATRLQQTKEDLENTENKVAQVCSTFRTAMEARADVHQWFTAILTTYVVEANLGAALQCVAVQRVAELDKASLEQRGLAEQGVRHLLTYVDAETLYRAALGVYELEVAYLVVNCSSKDPAEHLLQLQEFRNAGPSQHRVKYMIDMYLERWASALQHLLDAGNFQAALALAQNKQLLRQLLAACPHDSPHRTTVLKAHAESLQAQHRLQDAAMAYVAAGCLEDALHVYQAAGCWQQALSIACRLHDGNTGRLSPSVVRIAADLATELASTHRFVEAAQVLLEYCDDSDSGVQLLCQGQQWREAVRQAWRCGRDDLLETVVHPAAAARAAAMIHEAGDALLRCDKYVERWRTVRSKRLVMQEWQGAQHDDDAAMLEDDAVSVASSVVSGMSVYTNVTHATTAASTAAPSTVGGRPADSKKKKKKRDKQHKIRQGSEEEEGQLHALLLAMGPSDALLLECSELMELLIGSGHEEDAQTLQGCIGSWVERFEVIRPEVQAKPPPNPAKAAAATGLAWKWDVLRSTVV